MALLLQIGQEIIIQKKKESGKKEKKYKDRKMRRDKREQKDRGQRRDGGKVDITYATFLDIHRIETFHIILQFTDKVIHRRQNLN